MKCAVHRFHRRPLSEVLQVLVLPREWQRQWTPTELPPDAVPDGELWDARSLPVCVQGMQRIRAGQLDALASLTESSPKGIERAMRRVRKTSYSTRSERNIVRESLYRWLEAGGDLMTIK